MPNDDGAVHPRNIMKVRTPRSAKKLAEKKILSSVGEEPKRSRIRSRLLEESEEEVSVDEKPKGTSVDVAESSEDLTAMHVFGFRKASSRAEKEMPSGITPSPGKLKDKSKKSPNIIQEEETLQNGDPIGPDMDNGGSLDSVDPASSVTPKAKRSHRLCASGHTRSTKKVSNTTPRAAKSNAQVALGKFFEEMEAGDNIYSCSSLSSKSPETPTSSKKSKKLEAELAEGTTRQSSRKSRHVAPSVTPTTKSGHKLEFETLQETPKSSKSKGKETSRSTKSLRKASATPSAAKNNARIDLQKMWPDIDKEDSGSDSSNAPQKQRSTKKKKTLEEGSAVRRTQQSSKKISFKEEEVNASPPTTPTTKRSRKLGSETPKSSQTKGVRTPRNTKSAKKASVTATPRAVKRETQIALEKMMEEMDSEDSDYSPSSSSEASEPDEVHPKHQPILTSKTILRSRQKLFVRAVENADEYFEAQGSRTLTSDHTLGKVNLSDISMDSMQKHVREGQKHHESELNDIMAELQLSFPKWMFCLSQNFNILLHGLGSKRGLLNLFRKECLSEETHVVINGYFPALTLQHILSTVIEGAFGTQVPQTSVQDQLDFIIEASEAETLYLVINNIDGSTLRSEKTQRALAFLAAARNIHIIASVDHINTALLWDQRMQAQFNWLWIDATTFQPYFKETAFENQLLSKTTGALALSSLRHVFHSLTPNAQGIFILLLKNRLDHTDDPTFGGMPFSQCYSRCREEFLASSDAALRANLTEFRDHKLLRFTKAPDGSELLHIPLDTHILMEFLSELQDDDHSQ